MDANKREFNLLFAVRLSTFVQEKSTTIGVVLLII